MKYYADLHIHSGLSPCASSEMTPNNIVNMAYIKGLDIIAVTDHNSLGNYGAVKACADRMGILAVAGMEVETAEEVHLVLLFPDGERAFQMERIVYDNLPERKNVIEIFGNQHIFDERDNITGEEERFLIGATKLNIEELCNLTQKLDGVYIPAHIDRESNSILTNLGGIPEEINPKYLEYSRRDRLEEILKKNPKLKKYKFIRSSDAHNLGDILEPVMFFDLEERTAPCLIDHLLRG